MLLNKLTLTNFAPFYEEHEIDLGVGESAPVTVIHGENMRGKTSLMNAIRWCLYGSAIALDGSRKPTVSLMNIDALDAGESYMSVTLDFDHDGRNYELERHVQSLIRPRIDAQLEHKTYLKRDGQFVPERDIQETIASILHEEISRFFLFDGEMLDHYESLVSDPDTRTDLLRQSIERILGLPAIQLAVDDLESLESSATRRQRRAVRQDNKARKLSEEADKVEDILDALEADIADMSTVKEGYQRRIDELGERRRRHVSVEADARQAENLGVQIDENQQLLKELESQIQGIIGDAWAEPAASRASVILRSLENQYDEARRADRELTSLELRMRSLQMTLKDSTCPVCGQDAGVPEMERIRQELDTLSQRRGELTFSAAEYETLAARIGELREFTNATSLVSIREKEITYRRVRLQTRKLRQQLGETMERLRDHDRSEVRRVQQEYDKLVGDLRELNNDLQSKKRFRTESRADRSRIGQEISKLPQADPLIATESSIYSALRQGYSDTVHHFREELRVVVEERASEIFRLLTTESDYAKLVINNRYGLEIVDSNERVINERSAGAEQVVALALISALNQAAVREGPIVMDTPFGRLDTVHRENILKFIPTMGSQIILLVQSGEFDIDRDLPHLDGKIGRRYRLIRDDRPTRSRIVSVEV